MARRFDEALAHYHTALELAPGSLHGLIGVSNVLHDAERYEEALTAELEMVRAGRGDPELAEAMMRGFADGDYRTAMQRGAELLAHRSLTVDVAPDRISRLYLRAGEAESALDWLERSYDERDPNLPYINSGHQLFELLRGRPRFRALLKKMNFL